MPFMNLGKKIQPARKGWKGLTFALKTKLHKLKRSRSINKAKANLTTTFSTFLYCHRTRHSSPRLRCQTKARTQPPNTLRTHHHQSFAPVYVDELFNRPVPAPIKLIEATSTGKAADEKAPPRGSATAIAMASGSTAGELKLWGVDERAEQFIAKFKEEIKLQRQKSLEEYQEMLARGAM